MEGDNSCMAAVESGLTVYEYIVNNFSTCEPKMPVLYEKLMEEDKTGQFLASTARFLAAVDREGYAKWIPALIEGAIEKDREHKYIGSLLKAIWGEDYQQNVEKLRAEDNNFRRIYKRIYPDSNCL